MGIFKVEIVKNNNNINSLEDWSKFAAPTKADHWKDGRSARELAKYILSDNGYLPQEIEDILLQIGCSQDKIFKGEPEKITSLKVGRGTGRHHDLLLEQEKEIVVGIEAKADETFGKNISEELVTEDISRNKVNRINTLYKNLYGCDIAGGTDIRYQLLTGVSGTLLEAKAKNIQKALFLIITFKKEGSYNKEKLESNIKDMDIFINSLAKNKANNAYKFKAYKDIELYIEYIEIDVK